MEKKIVYRLGKSKGEGHGKSLKIRLDEKSLKIADN